MSAYRRGLTGKAAALGCPATEAAQKGSILTKNFVLKIPVLMKSYQLPSDKYHTRDTASINAQLSTALNGKPAHSKVKKSESQ